jgi:uncharacterized protein (TIGR03000 family)
VLTVSVRADETPVPADKAVLIVRLPANARLTIESTSTAQTGPQRVFTSPTLPRDRNFVYVLEATWTESGQERRAERKARVRAGAKTEVDFNAPEPAGKTRTFRFTYSGSVTDLPPGKSAHIWVPLPPSNDDQEVKMVAKQLPGEGRVGREPKFGNQMLTWKPRPGRMASCPCP